MLKRPFCGMAVCFLFGILGAAYLESEVWIGLCVCVLLVSGMCLAKYFDGDTRRIRFRVCLCVAMILLGYFQYQGEQMKRDAYLSALSDGIQLTIQGKVAGKQYQNNQYIYELESCYLGPYQNEMTAQEPIPCNRILAYSNSDVSSIGEILVLNGTVKLWESAVNEGNFDAKSFYLARQIDFRVNDIEILSRHGKASAWREGLFQLKLRLQEIYQSAMSEDACGVITTMVLGDKTLLSAETKRLYQTAGLSHVMAISGLHISIVGMSLYQFLRKRGLGFGVAGAVAGILLYLYGTMVGMGTSVQRSVGMFVLLLLAQTIGRSYDSLNALGVMALVLLWRNPFLLWDAGFQFSFTAIIGVAWLGKCVSFEDTPHEKFKEKLFVSGAIQMATLPLVVWNYYEIPLYALIVNLAVLPLMGVVLSFGIAGGFVGLVSVKGGTTILFFCEKILAFIRGMCAVCERLSYSMVIVGRPKLGQVVCYYIVLVTLGVLAYRRKKDAMVEPASGKNTDTQKEFERYGWIRKLTAISFLFVVLFFPASWGFEMDVLDVGQGDAIFLRTEEGHTIFVDGGSTNVSQVGTYRILPFLKYNGVRKIDFWFVSHTDEDHISGLCEILAEGYPVEQLVFAQGIVQDETYQKLTALAEANGTKILYLTAGDMLHLGDARIHVLYPATGTETGTAEADFTGQEQVCMQEADKNAESLVFAYEEGNFSAIFTGDIGSEQEQELSAVVRSAYETGRIMDDSLEVYKAAHHGSKSSNSEAWLALLHPEISVVSCAKKNERTTKMIQT